MSYFDDPLSGKNPWMPRHDAYGNGTVVHEVVIEDTEKIRAWKEHAAKLQEGFAEALKQRDICGFQRNAWRSACIEVRDRLDPNFSDEEIIRIYRKKKEEIGKEHGIDL
ncbi:hypothetical protein [Geoalkalibacter sp.]|uniref:hypothetical protein n=1 Tax=Geoalkalibacter sp. TaxID=3041440 RepID=UPI00272E7FD2|nr:hypothetical protein [Geoalkalibacter sp.]